MSKGSKLIEFRTMTDERGNLSFGEYPKDLPFKVERVFYFFDCPDEAIRGNHAHKASRQVHICMAGKVIFSLDNGVDKWEVVLNKPNIGLVIEPMIWHTLKMKNDSRLFVLSSDIYKEDDYIRNYDDFLKMAKKKVN